jgi:tetratricopeptide (TPR) repeat protein
VSIAYKKAGDAERQLGAVSQAREKYRKGLRYAEEVVAIDPRNAESKQALAVMHQWVGEANRALGDLKAASKHAHKCLELLEGVVAADRANLAARRDLGIACLALGEVKRDLGDSKAAAALFERGLRVAEELHKTDLNDARFRRDVLVACNKLGDLLSLGGRAEKALHSYQKSFAQAEAIVALDASNAEARHDLALGHVRICDCQLQLKRLSEARAQALKGVELLRPLVQADPKNSDYANALGSVLLRVGQCTRAAGDIPAARAAFADAAQVFGQLLKAHPDNPRFERDLLIAWNNQGDICVEYLNDLKAGGEHYRKSFALAEGLARRHPDSVEDQGNLALGLNRLGQHPLQAAEHARAIEHYQRADGILRQLQGKGKLPVYLPRRADIQRLILVCGFAQRGANDLEFALAQPTAAARLMLVQRVQLLTRGGRHAEAARVAEKLRALGPDSATVLFDTARCYALCAAAVAPGKMAGELTDEERAERARYTARSLELLTRALERGFRNLPRLEADSDLTAVRGEEDFRKLLQRLRSGP